MLQIDLKAQNKKTVPVPEKPEPNPAALNQYNSLNRAQRIKSLARIVDDNKQILCRLQGTTSHYVNSKWEQEHERK